MDYGWVRVRELGLELRLGLGVRVRIWVLLGLFFINFLHFLFVCLYSRPLILPLILICFKPSKIFISYIAYNVSRTFFLYFH